jgi:hypothetical protein
MANKKISELPLIQRVSGSVGYLLGDLKSVIPIVVAGTTTQMIVEDFSKFVNAYNAHTGSAGNTFKGPQTIQSTLSVTGNASVGGNLVVAGRITAEEFHTEITTASVIYASGSTKFGDTSNDIHEFTGSIQIGGETLGNAGLNAFTASAGSQLSRILQTTASIQFQTASLLEFTASQANRNFVLSIVTGSINRATASLQQASASLQTFTASQDARNFVLGIVTGSINQATASIQTQTASLLAFTSSQDSRNFTLSQVTASFNYFYQATASLQAFSSSQADRNLILSTVTGSINQATASLQTFTASQADRNLVLSIVTGSINQATASIQTQTASLLAFTASQDGRNLTLSTVTGSLIGITNGLMAFTAALDNTYATDAQLYQLYQATRSLELHSGSMVGVTNGLMQYTASLKNSTIVSSSAQIFTGYDNEIHVSQVDGNDTTGNGDFLTPVASITKALTLVAGQRRIIVVHSGGYTESPSITTQYTTITTYDNKADNTILYGTLSTNTGCTISGLKMTNLTITTPTSAGSVNVLNCDISGTLTKNSSCDFTLIRFTDIATGSISGAGLVDITGGNSSFVTVNNAGAQVLIKNGTATSPVLTAGNLNLVQAVVIASPTNAVTSAPGSIITIANSQLVNAALTGVAPVVLNGFYSILNTIYDRPASTLVGPSGTGGSANSIDYFQYINADKFITQGGTGYQFLKGDGSLDSIMPSSLQQTTASLNLTTGSIKGEIAGIEAYTASLKAAISVSGTNVQIIGDLNVNKLNVQYISSSVLVTSGSNTFGDQSTDKHEFTGSVYLQNSLVLGTEVLGNAGLNAISASTRIELNSIEAYTSSIKNSTIVSSSNQLGEIAGLQAYTSSLKSVAIVSSSQQIQNYNLFAVTSSANIFYGTQRITGSLSVSGSAGLTHTIQSGYVILQQVSQSLNFVDDTAAAAGGVPLGGLYRNGNFIVIRIV